MQPELSPTHKQGFSVLMYGKFWPLNTIGKISTNGDILKLTQNVQIWSSSGQGFASTFSNKNSFLDSLKAFFTYPWL